MALFFLHIIQSSNQVQQACMVRRKLHRVSIRLNQQNVKKIKVNYHNQSPVEQTLRNQWLVEQSLRCQLNLHHQIANYFDYQVDLTKLYHSEKEIDKFDCFDLWILKYEEVHSSGRHFEHRAFDAQGLEYLGKNYLGKNFLNLVIYANKSLRNELYQIFLGQ